MGTINLTKNRSVKQTGKSGIENSRDVSSRQQADDLILQRETDRLVRQLNARLPTLDENGQLKEKLYAYIERNFRELSARYFAAADDEMGKTIRAYFEAGVAEIPVRAKPKKITGLLDGAEAAKFDAKFNTGEIEKAAAPEGLKAYTDAILRQKTGMGAFVNEENAASVVKCVFKDNAIKPKTVTDVSLRLNIPDSDLIPPVLQYQAAAAFLVRELICGPVIDSIDREIGNREIDNHGINDTEDSKYEKIAAEEFFEKITGANIDNLDFSGLPDSIDQNIEIESIRDTGFNAAVNSLAALLENARMDYQFIEKTPDRREAIIREYEDDNIKALPDERYQIRLCYYDKARIAEERNAYDLRIENFESKTRHLWGIVDVLYQDSKSVFKVNDYEDLARKNRNRIKNVANDTTNEPPYGNDLARVKLAQMRERTEKIYAAVNSAEREILEKRLSSLENEYADIGALLNPHQLKTGILLELEITSIKQKKTTLTAMANALNQFLLNVAFSFRE